MFRSVIALAVLIAGILPAEAATQIPLKPGYMIVGSPAGLSQNRPVTGDITLSSSAVVAIVNLPAISGVNLTNLNASNLASGMVGCARQPALTGDVTSSAGSCATTLTAGSASNLNSGTLLSGRLAGSYTGITAVGTLSSCLNIFSTGCDTTTELLIRNAIVGGVGGLARNTDPTAASYAFLQVQSTSGVGTFKSVVSGNVSMTTDGQALSFGVSGNDFTVDTGHLLGVTNSASNVANGTASVAGTAALGPTGTACVIASWWKVKDNSGNTRYMPFYSCT